MSIYLIALTEPDDQQVWVRVKTQWPERHYVVTGQLGFIAPEEPILVEEICKSIGMNPDGQITGFVTRINVSTINGWTKQALWEWLDKYT